MNYMAATVQSLIFVVAFGAIIYFVQRRKGREDAGTLALRMGLIGGVLFFILTLIGQWAGYV